MTGSPGYDLHTHSRISDGTTTPSEIALAAAAAGLSGFALTDHDTIAGWEEARAASAAAGIGFLPGIEITTKHAGSSRHLLGYGVSPAPGELFTALDRVRAARETRAQRMVELLATRYRIGWDDVAGEPAAVTVGRPHIADALVSAGYFADRSTVFAEILHPGSPYYVPTEAIDAVEAIRLVRDAGGAAVLAHPAAKRQRSPVSAAAVRELAAAGLWGVELAHPEHRDDWLPPLRRVVAELGLATTGSSDFHGSGKPNRLGECTTPDAVVAELRGIVATPR